MGLSINKSELLFFKMSQPYSTKKVMFEINELGFFIKTQTHTIFYTYMALIPSLTWIFSDIISVQLSIESIYVWIEGHFPLILS